MKLINKPLGKTPLEALYKLKEKHSELQNVKLAYAGRLDPLAEGLLVVLEGEECKNRDHFQNMTKEYIFEILFGFSTDSYDLMGLILDHENVINGISDKELQDVIDLYKSEWLMEYPPYCAKPIDGVPMYRLARSGKLDLSNLPTKEVKISEINLLRSTSINTNSLLHKIKTIIPTIKGDFRQDEVVKGWETQIASLGNQSLQIAKIKVSVSSGTYVRTLAKSIGDRLNVPALALSIKRTRVGKYHLDDALNIF